MAVTYTTPDGTVVATLAALSDWAQQKTPGAPGGTTPTNAEYIVTCRRKPGTPQS